MSDSWYFAYGSNLSKGRKQERTGLIRRAVRARLRNYRLAFNKEASGGGVYANVVPEEGSEVWGVIYLCNPTAMTQLDRYEGVMGGHYVKVSVTVELEDGSLCDAETYIAGEDYIVSEGTPDDWYLDFILTGAIQHELPEDYIADIKRLAGK
jgi:cation transport regulator ChaC